jgi:hypothetical protein
MSASSIENPADLPAPGNLDNIHHPQWPVETNGIGSGTFFNAMTPPQERPSALNTRSKSADRAPTQSTRRSRYSVPCWDRSTCTQQRCNFEGCGRLRRSCCRRPKELFDGVWLHSRQQAPQAVFALLRYPDCVAIQINPGFL